MTKAETPPDPLAELDRAIDVIVGRPATAETRERFARYLALLTSWNRTHHLTAYRTARDIVRGLFIDSLLFLPLLPPRPHRLVDIGSGPGIPGVPLALVEPHLSVTLIESRRKPVSFLSALGRELGLGAIEVVHGRAGEDAAHDRGRYGSAVVRGVRLDPQFLAAALGYLQPEGRLIAATAPSRNPSIPTGHAARIETVRYPALGLSRTFIVFGP